MDILYTINNKYIDIFLASIYSLLYNGNIKNLKIHIITSDFSKSDYQKIELFLKEYDVEYYFYPLETFDIEKYNIPNWKNSQIANSRLFFQEILKKSIDNIDNLLYLDSDTIIIDDLNSIKNYKNGLFAVKDCGRLRSECKNFGNLKQYYNSGVLYICVAEWLNNDYQSKIINNIQQYNKNLSLPDQDLLNINLSQQIKTLPLKYNMPPCAYILNEFFSKLYFNDKIKYVGYNELQENKKSPIILHSYGLSNIKPWDSEINPFHDEFMKYILSINPNFKNDEFNKLQKMVIASPKLFYLTKIIRCYLPNNIEQKVKEISSYLKK